MNKITKKKPNYALFKFRYFISHIRKEPYEKTYNRSRLFMKKHTWFDDRFREKINI